MSLWSWLKQKRDDRKYIKLASIYFKFRWNQYKDMDCPERNALVNYRKAKIRIAERGRRQRKQNKNGKDHIVTQIEHEQAILLWEQGYKHGDYVLIYDPFEGSLTEEVIVKFFERPSFIPSDMFAKYEKAQGNRVKSGDRTQRASQPNLKSHEAGWLTPGMLPHSFYESIRDT